MLTIRIAGSSPSLVKPEFGNLKFTGKNRLLYLAVVRASKAI
jgi:hypothetical protein